MQCAEFLSLVLLLLCSYCGFVRAADVGRDEAKTRLEDLDAKQFKFDSPYVIDLPDNYQMEAETGEGRKFSKGSYNSFTFGIGPGTHRVRSDKSRYHAHLDITITLVEGQPELEKESSIADDLADVKRSTISDKFESEKPLKREKVNSIEFTVARYNRSDHGDNQ